MTEGGSPFFLAGIWTFSVTKNDRTAAYVASHWHKRNEEKRLTTHMIRIPFLSFGAIFFVRDR